MIVLSCPHCGDTERFGLRVDEHNRQSARAGNTVRTRPRQQRHQIHSLLLVPDAQSDPCFSDNPLVTGSPRIRFYAGMPLITSDGLALGSLCVLDQKPRHLSVDQQVALRVLGNQVASQLEMKRHITVQEQLIAERSRAEVELERALTQNAQVLASISSILIGVGVDGIITTWNQAASAAFGLKTSEALGQRFSDCGIRWNWKRLLAAVKVCEDGRALVRLEDMSYLLPDGKERFLGVTLNPISHHSDEPQGFLLLAADITDRRVLEGQLAHAQKLESIGQLAAGIAHEINTPIQYAGDNTRRSSMPATTRAFCRRHGAICTPCWKPATPPSRTLPGWRARRRERTWSIFWPKSHRR